MKSILVIAVAMLFLVPVSRAQNTAANLRDDCKSYIDFKDEASATKADISNTMYCLAYISGYAQGLNSTVVRDTKSNKLVLVKLKKDVTADEIARLYLREIDKRPEWLHLPANAVLFKLLMEFSMDAQPAPTQELQAVLQ